MDRAGSVRVVGYMGNWVLSRLHVLHLKYVHRQISIYLVIYDWIGSLASQTNETKTTIPSHNITRQRCKVDKKVFHDINFTDIYIRNKMSRNLR